MIMMMIRRRRTRTDHEPEQRINPLKRKKQ
jgi:hypothetical protein